ncbi:hypothetical protein PCC7418_0910 [Halothece sp. PCC 7418]|uniref:hypothetical protein n=1 Tax=Halothece sp. (strain PCC 7418) TaxID=65093 RepID=UPI0002A086ED|nr:hypothetical protein [Halothece sp. PCC 7418]AFZ43121.1 hypothetical protein PCC7418_0910 [Halothece sp. PCC 7418]
MEFTPNSLTPIVDAISTMGGLSSDELLEQASTATDSDISQDGLSEASVVLRESTDEDGMQSPPENNQGLPSQLEIDSDSSRASDTGEITPLDNTVNSVSESEADNRNGTDDAFDQDSSFDQTTTVEETNGEEVELPLPTEITFNDDETSEGDFILVQSASPKLVGGGAGEDTYIISPSVLDGTEEITITDTQGNSSIQLVEGLEIQSSLVAANALQLTLSNGTIININEADRFTYEAGGNAVIGIDEVDNPFDTFVEEILGLTLPTGINTLVGGAVTIISESNEANAVDELDEELLAEGSDIAPPSGSPNSTTDIMGSAEANGDITQTTLEGVTISQTEDQELF